MSGWFPGYYFFFLRHPGFVVNFNRGNVSKLWYRSGSWGYESFETGQAKIWIGLVKELLALWKCQRQLDLYRQHPKSKNGFYFTLVSRSKQLYLEFRDVKQMNTWIEIAPCCSCVQNLKIPLKLSSFARETDLIFLLFFGCCL